MVAFEFKQYQRRVIESQARFMILLWARQLGKGFTIAYKVVNDVMAHEASGRATTWIIMAASLRQAAIARAQQVIDAMLAELGLSPTAADLDACKALGRKMAAAIKVD